MDKTNPFINKPTRTLVEALREVIGKSYCLRDNKEVLQALAEFEEVCKRPPSIVPYVTSLLEQGGLTKKQFELLMFAISFRAEPSYSAIPATVATIKRVGLHKTGRIINDNNQGESGNRMHASHAELLYASLATMAANLQCQMPLDDTYQLARQIYRLRRKPGKEHFGDNPDDERIFHSIMAEGNIALPVFHNFKKAVYFCNLADSRIACYQNEVTKALQGFDDLGELQADVNPNNKTRLAVSLLELATREASSADEFETGKLSYIGLWGKVVRAYLGHVSKDVTLNAYRKDAVAWSDAHVEAEYEHARDALERLIDFLMHVHSPSIVVDMLHTVTNLTRMRGDYWDQIIEHMEKLGEKDEKIPLNPAEYEPPNWRARMAYRLSEKTREIWPYGGILPGY